VKKLYRVYQIDGSKKAEVEKIIETDPYSQDSFARVGYKLKEGKILGEEAGKYFLYIKSSEEFIKKADEKLKDICKIAPKEVEERIVLKIIEEEEAAERGLGDIFG
jgi:hypothetical protein